MYGFIIVLTLIEFVFGVMAFWLPSGWMYGVPIIVSCLIMFWLADGAHKAYKTDEELSVLVPLNENYKEEQERMMRILCKKLGISEKEIKQLASEEEIQEKKHIDLENAPAGFKVVFKKAKQFSSQIIKEGDLGTLISYDNLNKIWKIRVLNNKGEAYVLKCNKDEIENYYSYKDRINQIDKKLASLSNK